MADIVRLPIIPRQIPAEANTSPMQKLDAAIRECVAAYGRSSTVAMLTEAMRLSDVNGWRDRARSVLVSPPKEI